MLKSLYGLKQASRCWNKKFTNLLKSFDLVASKADPCVFIKRNNNKVIILAIYIDDGLIAVSDESDAGDLIERLSKEFYVSFRELSYFLGLKITTDSRGSIYLHQEGYARKILDKFGMSDCNPISVPMDPQNIITSLNPQEFKPADNVPYRQLVGSLMYLAIGSRPDIAFALSCLSQYLEKPEMSHWNALKRILRYIKGTLRYSIKFSGVNTCLSVYSDADFAGDIVTRRSHTGFVFLLGSGPVSWCSQKQKTVALSTTESEYIAASESIKELIWLSLLFKEMAPSSDGIPSFFCDNQSTIKLIKNPEFHKRTKQTKI